MVSKLFSKRHKPLISERILNILIFCILIALLAVVICFHEPWFDEAESWLIAKDEPILDLIFVQTRYEGHPPLWWLLLSIPAKLGMPYEISIKTIELLLVALGEYLLIFKSPFPKWLRYTLPFTYFLFYQYGVQARPYSLMVLSVFLLASIWKTRNVMPFRVCGVLALVCLTSAFGIIIAGGITLVWVWESLMEKSFLANRRRLVAMGLLLVFALVEIFIIRPYPDTFATRNISNVFSNTLAQRLFYAFFCLPSELFATAFADDTNFKSFMPTSWQVLAMTVISILIWITMIGFTRKRRKTAYLLVPYALLACFSSVVYMYMHHMGIYLVVFLFAGWISCSSGNTILSVLSHKKAKTFVFAFLCVGIVVNIFWTGMSVVNDIRYDFSAGRLLRNYVENNDLLGYNWISTWAIQFSDNEKEVLYEDTHQSSRAVVEANPYLAKPLLGDSLSGKSYIYHKVPSAEEMQNEIEKISASPPDFIVGFPNKGFYEHTGLKPDYVRVKELRYMQAWKNKYPIISTFIFAKKEIADNLKIWKEK